MDDCYRRRVRRAALYHVDAKPGGVCVKRGKRLIKKIQIGIARKCACNGNAGLHTARKLIRVIVFVSRKPQFAQYRARILKPAAAVAGNEIYIFRSREPRQQSRRLHRH